MGKDLIERTSDAKQQTRMLFEASFVIVSHGAEPDPILNYGNQIALNLWELPWDQFIKTSSRLTAEPDDRAERETRRLLKSLLDRAEGGETITIARRG